jgi:hypothetical protein
MDRQRVLSSNLYAVGYDTEEQILEIEFQAGPVYRYYSVPASVYLALMHAGSKGTYFDRRIRKGPFRYRQVW